MFATRIVFSLECGRRGLSEKSVRKEGTASPSESKVKRGGREARRRRRKRRDEQKTRKRIGEYRYIRTRGKRRAGKSERVQLPTGNGKQTKWGKRGKGRDARTSWKKLRERKRERENVCGGGEESKRKKKGEEAE